ncbi:MAG: PilN domain-containing protein [Pseudomonas sp.]|jgi:general secretion pathway protein L|nr:PilN domain-containing protein [Pseudomonas sp.]
MRFEIGNLQLFGLDLNALFKRGKAGLIDILPAGLAGAFVHPAPAIDAIVEKDSVRFLRQYPGKGTEIVTLQHSELELAADSALKADLSRGIKSTQLQLSLVMPEEQVMRKRMTLPKAARHNLRDVVSFQVARLTPFSADKVFFDVVEMPSLTPTSDTIDVEFIAVLKTEAQPWINEIERITGTIVARLKVAQTQYSTDLRAVNLFSQPRVKNAWWLRLNRNMALLAVLIVLLLITAVLPALKLRTLVLERKQEIQVVEQRVADLQVKRQVLEHDLASLNYVLEQRAYSALPSKVIEELTRIVPDDIYINNLSVQKQTVVFSGIGTGVVDLIELLNSSPLFEDAKFTASITRGSQGQDIFTASLQLTAALDNQL